LGQVFFGKVLSGVFKQRRRGFSERSAYTKERMMNDFPNQNNNMPNMKMIKGLLAVIFGIICIMLAYKVVVSILFFILGFGLVYYGLTMLGMQQATNFIEDTLRKLRKLLPF